MVVKETPCFLLNFLEALKGGIFSLPPIDTTLNCLRRKSRKIKTISNKSQFKIQQMAFMLLAVTLFFVLAGIFVLIFKFSDLKDAATEISEKNALLLVTRLANSPEFSCGEVFDYAGIACIDSDKVMALKQSQKEYGDFWGVLNIEIRKILSNKTDECTIKNYPDCGFIKIKRSDEIGDFISNFVILCRKNGFEGEVYDKCEISRLMVSYKPI